MIQHDATILGYLHVPEGVQHEQSYEVAAWYTLHALTPGRYPVRASRSYGKRGLYADVPTTIVRNHTPALFGGVQYGDGDPQTGRASSVRLGGGHYAYNDAWNDVFAGVGTFEPLPGADLRIGDLERRVPVTARATHPIA